MTSREQGESLLARSLGVFPARSQSFLGVPAQGFEILDDTSVTSSYT